MEKTLDKRGDTPDIRCGTTGREKAAADVWTHPRGERERHGIPNHLSISAHPGVEGIDDQSGASSSRLHRMSELLRQMTVVDLDELCSKLSDAESNAEKRDLASLCVHSLRLLKYFLKCSSTFVSLAYEEHEEAAAQAIPLRAGVGATTSGAPLSETGRGAHPTTSFTQPSRPAPLPSSPSDVSITESPSPFLPPPTPAMAMKDEPPAALPDTIVPPSAPPSKGRVLHHRTSDGASHVRHTITDNLSSADGCPQHGDCHVLHSGAYEECLHIKCHGAVELTAAYPGVSVVLRPSSDLEPILTVRGADTRVLVKGLVFVVGTIGDSPVPACDPSTPSVPLVSVLDGAQVTLEGCHIYYGTGAGVAVGGMGTLAVLRLCVVACCAYAGVYVYGGAVAEVAQSQVKRCEVGVRCAAGRFRVRETTIEQSDMDGVVVHEEGGGVLERVGIFRNAGNGLFMATGTDVHVEDSSVELNALYGIQRLGGSVLHLRHSIVRDNGLCSVSHVGE